MARMQSARAVGISTPLGDDVLLFHRMTATEALGRLFRYELDLLSEEKTIKFDALLGQNVTVRLELPDGGTRYFNGFVSRFSQEGAVGDLCAYQATVHPWLWFLTRTADCRIFEKDTFAGEMTVPNMIKQVFREHGFTDFEDALSGTYRTWDYCTQYRETDFNFVSRLMEQEGIYYYFRHEDGQHTLVLSDSVSSHAPLSGYERVPYFPPDEHLRREWDHIYDWSISQEVQPGVYTLNDFDFKRPKDNLQAKSSMPRNHARAGMEIYDYPGEYTYTEEGEAYARARLEALQTECEQGRGQANARGLAVGNLFSLTDYPRQDQNREYLVIAADANVVLDTYGSTAQEEGEALYTCGFMAVDSKQPYRPARTTPKPLVQGPQTAMVVGPSGDEIYTDQYGRVKVRFHWDRELGRADEERSCWIRVAQVWAGSKWGSIHIPRIGQEVIVEFLEGDPDLPIITGRVYNADQMPPYTLPANRTQSGIKSRSSKGGTPENFNEIRFEGQKGSEEMYIHAEKDQNTVVEHDRTENIGHDATESVGHDETISIGNDRTETVGKNETISIGANRTESVGANESITVTQNRTRNVGQNETVNVALLRTHTVGVNEMINVGAAQEVTVGGAQIITVGLERAVTVKLNQDVNIGKTLTIDAGDQIVIQTGEASITMKKDGTIEINGKDIYITGSNTVGISGTDIHMTGSNKVEMGVGNQVVTCNNEKVETSGAGITSAAVGVHEISGAIVKLN